MAVVGPRCILNNLRDIYNNVSAGKPLEEHQAEIVKSVVRDEERRLRLLMRQECTPEKKMKL